MLWPVSPLAKKCMHFKRNINIAHIGHTAAWVDVFILEQTVGPWVEMWAKSQETQVKFPVKSSLFTSYKTHI